MTLKSFFGPRSPRSHRQLIIVLFIGLRPGSSVWSAIHYDILRKRWTNNIACSRFIDFQMRRTGRARFRCSHEWNRLAPCWPTQAARYAQWKLRLPLNLRNANPTVLLPSNLVITDRLYRHSSFLDLYTLQLRNYIPPNDEVPGANITTQIPSAGKWKLQKHR